MFGYLASDPVAAVTNNKVSLLISFIISVIAVLVMTFVHGLNEYIFAFVFLMLKSALCMSFSALYAIHYDLFPT